MKPPTKIEIALIERLLELGIRTLRPYKFGSNFLETENRVLLVWDRNGKEPLVIEDHKHFVDKFLKAHLSI